jgi:hypothetical protein
MTRPPACQDSPGHPRNICVGCKNQHGCLSPEPPCNTLARLPEDASLPGREWMQKARQLSRCETCALYRQCWNPEAFHRARAQTPDVDPSF